MDIRKLVNVVFILAAGVCFLVVVMAKTFFEVDPAPGTIEVPAAQTVIDLADPTIVDRYQATNLQLDPEPITWQNGEKITWQNGADMEWQMTIESILIEIIGVP